CERWSPLNNLVLARYPEQRGRFAHGNDGGCFIAALSAVRQFGGVLEHPAQSRAWWTFDLPAAGKGAWQRGICGGWSIEVDQWEFGHPARKRTWLYAFGMIPPVIPPIIPPAIRPHVGKVVRVYRRRNADGSWSRQPCSIDNHEISHRAAKATPPAFRDLLLSIARTAVT
ncbi:MAG TPA: hypothetical protein VGR45_10465, partial [Stellaceae bacterium]|nr:hypothetical protein [Stellaceae bacterium]